MSIWLLALLSYVCGCPTSLPITITGVVWSPEQPSPNWGASATISGYSHSEAWVNVNSCQIDVSTPAGIRSTEPFPCFYGLEQLGRDVKIKTGVWRLPEETLEGVHGAEIRLIGGNDQVVGCFQAPITLVSLPSPLNCTVNQGLTFSHLTWLPTASAFSLLLEGHNYSNTDRDLSSCVLAWTSATLPFPCAVGTVPQGSHFRVQSDNLVLPETTHGAGQVIGLSQTGEAVACWALFSLSP